MPSAPGAHSQYRQPHWGTFMHMISACSLHKESTWNASYGMIHRVDVHRNRMSLFWFNSFSALLLTH
ncbi:hypothetical protein XELAEV_18033785mg [Xenopus laevis]|uniref:Uncharacterized protein n=1 Tax=Xenopus laevis TaxID=8355 RepID=A0A974CK01_XENLA|nr:hypothetical protein XELAEV_18033785mg [Xenopus laevis]